MLQFSARGSSIYWWCLTFVFCIEPQLWLFLERITFGHECVQAPKWKFLRGLEPHLLDFRQLFWSLISVRHGCLIKWAHTSPSPPNIFYIQTQRERFSISKHREKTRIKDKNSRNISNMKKKWDAVSEAVLLQDHRSLTETALEPTRLCTRAASKN